MTKTQGLAAALLAFSFNIAEAQTMDLSGTFREADTGKGVLALSYSGAQARATFDFIKAQSPELYRVMSSGQATFEHINGSDIFCAKDTLRGPPRRRGQLGPIVRQTFRCDLKIGGSGRINPPLMYVGSEGGGDGGGGYDGGGYGGDGGGGGGM